jgi:hypothetical protein
VIERLAYIVERIEDGLVNKTADIARGCHFDLEVEKKKRFRCYVREERGVWC